MIKALFLPVGKIRIPLCTFQTMIPGGNLVTSLTPSALPGTHRTRADVRPAGQPLQHFPQAAGWALRDLRDKHTLPGVPEPLPLPLCHSPPWRGGRSPHLMSISVGSCPRCTPRCLQVQGSGTLGMGAGC